MITLEIAEPIAYRLLGLCEREVKAIGAKLCEAGMAGLGKAITDLRGVSGLIAQLEAAGVKAAGKAEAAKSQPQPDPVEPDIKPEPEVVETGEPDEAPPPAVVAARAASKGANGSKLKFVRAGARAVQDMDASSGP
jgi:hypothetical protein